METKPAARPIVIGVLAAVLAAAITGGSVYAAMHKRAADDKKTLQAQVDSLKTQVAALPTAMPVPSASPVATASPATQTTYTNTKYGYSFEYDATANDITASAGNSDAVAISPTAEGVNVFPTGTGVGKDIFMVSAPGIELTTAAIGGQFGATKKENLSITPVTVAGASGYKAHISGDASVVSDFYFLKNKAGTTLELTVAKNNDAASAMLTSFLLSGSVASSTACQSKNLKIALQDANAAAGTAYKDIVLTNIGSAPCTLTGAPAVALLNAAGDPIGTADKATGTATDISLATNKAAYAAVGFPNPSNFPSGSCSSDTSAKLSVTLPGTVDTMTVALAKPYCPGFSVHSFSVTP